MDMTITVVHTLSPDVLQLLKNFLTGAPASSTNGVAKETPVVDMKQKKEKTPDANANPAEVKIEDIRAKVQEKQREGKRELVKALLSDFGTNSVTSLAPDKYGDFMQKLIAV